MKKIVWVNGCFDVIHRGHIELFKFAKTFGDFLVVGIDSDSRVRELKGNDRPYNCCEDRRFLLESIKFIDEVEIFSSEQELEEMILTHKVDVMVLGSDYINKTIIGSSLVEKIVFFNRLENYSTTKILMREK